jgi:hypothetical protein
MRADYEAKIAKLKEVHAKELKKKDNRIARLEAEKDQLNAEVERLNDLLKEQLAATD